MQGMESGALLSVASEHIPALIATFATPLAAWLLVANARLLARDGADLAQGFVRRLDRLSFSDSFAVLMMLTTGVAHLALVPTHWPDERQTAVLFLLNGIAFLAVVGAALLQAPYWRLAGLALLAATALAYAFYLATGREDADLVGLIVKVVEIAGLVALLLGAAKRSVGLHLARPLALALAAVTVLGLGGLVAGAALHSANASDDGTAHQAPGDATPMPGMGGMSGMASATPLPGMDGNAMANMTAAQQAMAQQISSCFNGQMPMPMSGDADMLMAPVPDRAPTSAEQSAADSFAQQVQQGIAQYAAVNAAKAAGYRPLGSQIPNTMTHWINIRFIIDGDPLDPARPGALMFDNTSNGPQLVGAMFMLPGSTCPVDFGGPITDWHVHTNLCYSAPQGGYLVGVQTARQPDCPAGSYSHVSQWMLHVWVVPVPGGPFAQAEQVNQALNQRAR